MMRNSGQLRRARWARRSIPAVLATTMLALPIGVTLAGAAPASRHASAARVFRAGPVTGTTCSPSCDIYAATGTVAAAYLPGAPSTGLPVYGYNTSDAAVAAPGGPTLTMTEGVASSIILHNRDIPNATSLMIAGQPILPDTTGVTADPTNNATTYTFAAGLKAGTYLYEAGLTQDGPRQAAMGLYGALVVRPAAAADQAYGDASTKFDDEAVLVLSEIDPALNADPAGFDMTTYSPKYWLINGKAYPKTDPITTDVGHTVLLRYVNAGLKHHSMGVLGAHQTIIAKDGNLSTNPMRVVAETIPTGTTLDTLLSVDPNAPAGAKYALYDTAMRMDNAGTSTNGVINFGGMLTFLTTASGTAAPAATPVTTNVAVAPNPTKGASIATLKGSIAGTPDADGAEYFIDTVGADGTGTTLTGSFPGASVDVSGTISAATLAGLTSGNHTLYVHGHNANGWGAVASDVLILDKTGPAISNTGVTPSIDNGTADVVLQATASDEASGNQNVTDAEYSIDGGASTAFTITAPSTAVSLSYTIPANGLGEGVHSISVRAKDALGNWGASNTVELKVDKTGPDTSITPPVPNVTNGSGQALGENYVVRIDATVTDPVRAAVKSNVVFAEYFVDTVGADGKGGSMLPTDGQFDSPSEAVYVGVETMHLNTLSEGAHTVYVHGKDAAGNWGPTSTVTLIIDRTAPTTSVVTFTPPAANNQAVLVSANATDNLSNISAGEFFIGAVGAAGTGTAMTPAAASPTTTISGTISAATVAALTPGNHTVYVRALDAAGNWGTETSSATLLIDRTAPTFTGITLNPTSITAGTASVSMTVNGATDPLVGGLASGVTGGEYWFGSTNIAAGTGTAFTGLTPSVTTSALSVGTYTVRVRIRDAAGNWSTTVRTAPLTVTPVQNRPTVFKVFAGSVRGGNGTQGERTTTLTITLSNSNAFAVTGVGLTDNMPQPAVGTFTVVSSSTTCGGATSTASNNRRLLLSNGTIPASGSCTITATVRLSNSATPGAYTLTNTIGVGGVTTANAGSNQVSASAILNVNS